MTRRELLSGTLALAAQAAPPPSPSKLIDVAAHFYDPARPQGVPWPRPSETLLYKRSLPDRYLADVKPYKVDGVVVIEASPWLEDNLWLLTLAEKWPLIRGVVGNIQPGHPDFNAALDRFSRFPLFKGIRVGAANLPKFLDGAEAFSCLKNLADKNLSLDVLVAQPQYADIARLAAALPTLRIVVGHLPLDDRRGMNALAAFPNVFAKISGVVRQVNGRAETDAGYYKPALDDLWNAFGPDRAIFATNWPVNNQIAPWPVVHKIMLDYLADQPASTRDKYFAGNAERAYKLT